MGGVTQAQINGVYVGLGAYLILLSGFGLLCSVVGSNNRSAATWMILGLLSYFLVPRTAATVLTYLVSNKSSVAAHAVAILEPIMRFSVFEQMGWILTTGAGEAIVSWQVIGNLSMGAMCFALAWALFGIFSRQPGSEPMTRGMIARTYGRFRWFSPGRSWANPLVWKDYYFVAGGLVTIPVRLAFCLALYVVAWSQFGTRGGPRNLYMDVSFYQIFLSLAVSIDAARLLARSVSNEIRGHTLSTLVMLPKPYAAVLYPKFAGALLGWLPGVFVEIVVTAITDEGRRNFAEMIRLPIGFYVTTFFVLIPHLAVVLSAYLRWGAVPLSVVIAFSAYIGSIMCLEAMFRFRPEALMLIPIGMFVLGVCAMCHLLLWLRIKHLAATT
jgi:hypothetical protein